MKLPTGYGKTKPNKANFIKRGRARMGHRPAKSPQLSPFAGGGRAAGQQVDSCVRVVQKNARRSGHLPKMNYFFTFDNF